MNSDAWKLVLSVGVAGVGIGLLMGGDDDGDDDPVEDSGRSSIADRARSDGRDGGAGDGGDELKCPECGATTNRKGEPFSNRAALEAHKRAKHG